MLPYTVPQRDPLAPKLRVPLPSGIILLSTSATNVTVSLAALPKLTLPLNCASPPTVSVPLIVVLPLSVSTWNLLVVLVPFLILNISLAALMCKLSLIVVCPSTTVVPSTFKLFSTVVVAAAIVSLGVPLATITITSAAAPANPLPAPKPIPVVLAAVPPDSLAASIKFVYIQLDAT